MLSTNKVAERLKHALQSDGDFPARAAVVSQIIELAESPDSTVEQITNVILREQSLGTRVLSLVNSAFYRRAEPVVTVSQAVVQLGMKSISQLCASLVIMDKFSNKTGGALTDNLKRSIIGSLLAGHFAKKKGLSEQAFLGGTFYDLGFLLLSFYFPQVYEAAVKRDGLRDRGVLKSISEILGVSRYDLNATVMETLELPEVYFKIIEHAAGKVSDPDNTVDFLTQCVTCAGDLAEAVIESKTEKSYKERIEAITSGAPFDAEEISAAMTELPAIFDDHCKLIEMTSLSLPHFLLLPFRKEAELAASEEEEQALSEFKELSRALINGDPIHSIIGLVMEVLVYEFKFQRALFLEQFSTNDPPRCKMFLGDLGEVDPSELPDVKSSSRADLKAMESGEITFSGKSIFDNLPTFVAIPIVQPNLVPAAIYADRGRDKPISDEELERLLSMHGILAKKLVNPHSY